MSKQPIIDCRIQPHPIDVAALRLTIPELRDCGGYVCFEGIVRDINHGKRVARLDYEVYEVLAVKEMTRIAEHAAETLPLRFIRCVHRSGALSIGEPAVIIQVLSKHRGEAFAGCRLVIDQLKTRVPIWKKEYYDDGSVSWSQCHDHGPEPSL